MVFTSIETGCTASSTSLSNGGVLRRSTLLTGGLTSLILVEVGWAQSTRVVKVVARY